MLSAILPDAVVLTSRELVAFQLPVAVVCSTTKLGNFQLRSPNGCNTDPEEFPEGVQLGESHALEIFHNRSEQESAES